MIRKIIKIDVEKCNGCGACARACHEGAIEMVDGKATLARENYCDGFGDCLPHCPTDAITFEEREAPAYDEAAVNKAKRQATATACQLSQWPCQIRLVPTSAPYFDNADLLIAADCTAYAYASIHTEFMQGHVTLIGCPKLDVIDYSEKLTEILKLNRIKSVTVLRMQVPCCKGLENAANTAIANSKKVIPCRVVTVTIKGELINN
ncbi:MAG: 4Fe-4S binding protein [Clostridiales bacterium]|nr:4Fe-4S binding protein [Clostridiales bacterium]